MLDAGITIIDRMISLLKEKERNRRKLFVSFVQPLFDDMAEVHKDYMKAFVDLIEQVENAATYDGVMGVLRSKKTEFEHLRVKIHSFLIETKKSKKSSKLPKEIREFFHICIRYFTTQSGTFGGVYGLHYSDLWQILYNRMEEPSLDDRATVEKETGENAIDILKMIDSSDTIEVKDVNNYLKITLDYLRERWAEVTSAYATCRLNLLN